VKVDWRPSRMAVLGEPVRLFSESKT
jgi:hypothetical protein